jgi:hypothetical protein
MKISSPKAINWTLKQYPHISKTGSSDVKTYSVLTSEMVRKVTVSMSEVVKYDGAAYGSPMSKQMVPHMVQNR